MFVEGDYVSYKSIKGTVSFICDSSISILIQRGDHKSQDVKVVVHKSDFKNVIFESGK